MPQPLNFQPVNGTGNIPTPRSGHTMTTVGKFHIMFGGLDATHRKSNKICPNNQVYTLRFYQGNCEWRLASCSGDIPQARTQHAACAISQDKLFVFGGYYTSNLRFNDVYILKVPEFQWKEPPNQKSGSEPKNTESKIGAPEPRANHSCSYHQGKVYVFGGHGGCGYQRTSFNDIYVYDCESSEWTKITEIGGNAPAPRGGHSAAVLAEEDKLLIYGGWSQCYQYSDVMIYDIKTQVWIDPELSHETPRWNHIGMMVHAIPSSKYFIFGGSVGNFEEGGNRTVSQMSDASYVLDMKSMQWSPIQLEDYYDAKGTLVQKAANNRPKARENSAMLYDNNDSRLVMFGGWSNNWLGDMVSLNVSSITGPPYAIYSIKPNLGPLTGKTRVVITGEGFKDSQNITVKFDAGKGSENSTGNYISGTEIWCETPALEQYGPRKADVTLTIGRGDNTITSSSFTYYLNTMAEHTICYGPGLLTNNATTHKSIFNIQARNKNGINRESGADEYKIQILHKNKKVMVERTREIENFEGQTVEEKYEEEELQDTEVEYQLKDNDDGTYTVEYKLDSDADEVTIDIQYLNPQKQYEAVRGNPFKSSWKKGVNKSNNTMTGPLMQQHIANQLSEIDGFIGNNKNEINIKNKNISEVFELLKVKESLHDIQTKKKDILLTMDVIEETLNHFNNKEDQSKDNEIKKVKKLQDEWTSLTKMSVMVEKDISGPVKQEGDKAKESLMKFDEKLKDFYMKMRKEEFYQYQTGGARSQQKIQEVQQLVKDFQEKLTDFDYFGKMFGFQEEIESPEANLTKIKKELEGVSILWQKIVGCQDVFNEYKKLGFLEFDCMEKEDEVKTLRKGLNDLKGIDKKSGVFLGIMEDIKKWTFFLPLCAEMRDPSMETPDGRHWDKIKKLVKKDFNIDKSLLINEVWDLELYKYKDDVEDITDQAKQELKMDRGLSKIVEKWQEVEFESIRHKDTNIYTLKMIDENFEQLEEHQMQINNMLLSKYIGFFEKEVEQWKQDLGAIYDVYQLLGEVQKSWSFLENLFIQSEEVKRELPEQSKSFIDIDKNMKEIMADGNQIKNVLKFCTQPHVLKQCELIQKELKICEKALNDFLDGKKRGFPRFYFCSVAGLLDILSNGNSPEKINRHMSKIFQAVDNVELEPDGERPKAKKMVTCVGQEEVKFSAPLKLVGKVENYLQDLIDAMRKTLNDICSQSISNQNMMKRREWIETDPAQITVLVNMMDWSKQVQICFDKIEGGDFQSLKKYQEESIVKLSDLIIIVQGKLEPPVRQKYMVLITMDTHSRDINFQLINEDVKKSDEFQWQSQLKSSWVKDAEPYQPKSLFKSDARLNICDAEFWYAYEYLGNGARLVITPLTDRIYVTATQALHLKMGCAPAGPAGTGKTETTKDLANANAKACYVFNCSGEMDYVSMGNTFKGLASSGCWGCFDEFNRLFAEVLSVCSVQFKAVCDAVKTKNRGDYFVIEGDSIKLDPSCGVFITMNPGYLGRQELPEGLKALFRPITVVVPEFELICENYLMAEGFIDAKMLAKKFVTLYSLCKDLLSKSDHYDWGLRAIKSVLVVAGEFKRSDKNLSEAALLKRALRDFNLPKIIAADLEIFNGLLLDLFPGINVERSRNMEFENIIQEVTKETKLHPDPEFILKVVQLRELLEIRHCVFVMGPPGSGKTKTWQTLAKSFDKNGQKTSITDLNPKVVSTKELYGFTLPSKEWRDGLLSKLLRNYAEIPDTNKKWIILDGDLDANWIESMNSVMDDNRILTLANNERIPLKGHMRMIFEIRDLRYATPATVSRAGILFISDDDGYQWRSYVKSWLNSQQYNNINNSEDRKQFKVNLQNLFDKYLPACFAYLIRYCKFVIPIVHFQMVVSLCRQLEKLLSHEHIFKCLEYVFTYAVVWAVGGVLCEKDGIDYRKEFSTWWKGEQKTSVKFPSKGTVFEYFVDISSDGQAKFDEWSKKLVNIDFDTQQGMIMSQITVPTRETISTSEFIKKFLLVQHPVLLIGNAGCGKTALAKGILKEVSNKPIAGMQETFNYQIINFNYYTDSNYLQAMMEQMLEKKAGKQYGPTGKTKLIYFIDDLNAPQTDPFNTQTSIALLRQHQDMQHWYDISKLTLKEITNTQHFASMNPSAGTFSVNPRYQRHFWISNIPFPDNDSLFHIFNTFLGGHLKTFRSSVQEQASSIIKASLQLHTQIVSSFRKTAVNFHYEFNIRHLSNIYEGLLITQSAQFMEPEKLVKLWIHEAERSYCDRLVSAENVQTYKAIMGDIVKKQFNKFNFSKYFQKENSENLIFCNFSQGITGEKWYDQLPNDKMELYINEALKEYNDNNPVMNLVLFEDAMKHVCRITRIVIPSGGHALLVGVGGSGKQSLAKLASYIMNFVTFSITISSTYGMNDLRTDLQSLYFKAGVKQEGMLFLFTEGQISNERFLVYINDLLSSGEIAELYTPEEKEVIINNLKSKCKAEKGNDNRDTVWSYFIEKVRQNLHMALCFSPMGSSFRKRALQFPAIVNCTVIDWFQDWPAEALLSVAENFLKDIEIENDEVRKNIVEFMPYSFKFVNQLNKQMLEQEKRAIFTTPKSFLELIQLYINMLTNKKNQLEEQKDNYETGLIKLQQTAEDVKMIEEDVKIKQISAEEKKVSADAFAEKVGIEKKTVEAESSKANIEAEKCNVIKKDVEEKQTSTQKDLDAAGPLIEQSIEALNSLQKSDFVQVKSFSTPPTKVPEVFFAAQLLMAGFWPESIEVDGKKRPKNVDWKGCLKMMKFPEVFMQKLQDFKEIVDANQVIAANVIQAKNLYLSDPDFTPEIIINKSKAACGVCKWVINIVRYWEVIQDVEPKRKQLKEANEQLEVATAKLNEVMAVVNELNESLAKLEAEYNQAMSEKNQAMEEAARYERRLNLANRLVKALGDENERWAASSIRLASQLDLLIGDVLVASAFISYAGPFNKSYRQKMMKDNFIKYITEKGIPQTPGMNPIKLLTDDATTAVWVNQGLPDDPVSIENGTILTSSQRYSLIIDPQLQGIQWIKEKEKANNLKSCRLGSSDIVRKMEFAIENGDSIIIENMDEKIDAILMPVICRATIKRGNKKLLKFGGKDLILSKNFRLFMQTKLSNPHYPPEIQAETTMINFTVTEEGLSDQLLVLVVGKERPDLSKKKTQIIQQQNDYKIRLKQLEDDLLYKLATAEGDILDNIELIENLEYSKKISVEVSKKVQIANITQAKINEASENYRPAADRGSLIYFLMTDLSKIHTYYKYSLDNFIDVMYRAIDVITEKVVEEVKQEDQKDGDNEEQKDKSKDDNEEKQDEKQDEEDKKEDDKDDDKDDNKDDGEEEEQEAEQEEELEDPLTPRSLNKRVVRLIDSITITAFNYTRRGLFEKHKLIVSCMLTLRILIRKGELTHDEVEHLILGKFDPNPPPMPEVLRNFVNEFLWANCKALETVHASFANFSQSLEIDHLQWKKWYNEEKAEHADLPKAFKEITKFHKLLLLRAMRPDRFTSALTIFISEIMGEIYVEQSPLDIDATYLETSCLKPIFFVLFPGVEPSGDINKIAQKYGFMDKKLTISMGQGQEPRAERALKDASKQGTWICLENLQLMQNWIYGIKGLEGILETCYQDAHPDFRAFFTAEPPPTPAMVNIPESILQSCVKVSNENPQDLKANLKRAYAKFDQEFIDKATRPNEFKSILFALCFFHSVICGRKKFGSQGWSKIYNFNDGDLTICADVLHNYLANYDIVPFQDLRYIYGEIMYGGHITDGWDRRTNRTYLLTYIKPELMQNMLLAPGFRSPDAAKFNYNDYKNFIETKLPIESPQMFGLHPNAEINYLTQTCDTLFATIMEVQSGGSGGGGTSSDAKILEQIDDYKSRTPVSFLMIDITLRIKEKTPHIVVALQECERMNILLAEINQSLEDLKLGITGALNMSDAMEVLSQCLQINKVPDNWTSIAYFSKKPLALWYNDLIDRNIQLQEWTKELITPLSVCISYLFNPMSFLTAIMQKTAREQGLPLDNMVLQTNVTQIKDYTEIQKESDKGTYIHGFFLEGAAWELGGQGQQGYLIEQIIKQLHPKMPVVQVEAVPIAEKKVLGQYDCPVYVTSFRGPTYVFTSNLNMENEDSDPNKWILSGTCMLMSDD